MGAIRTGRRYSGPTTVDNFHVDANTSNVSGTVFDTRTFLPDNVGGTDETLAYPDAMYAQHRITNASGNAGYDIDIRVKYSHDGVSWPDTGLGDSLGSYTSATLGDDMIWSNYVALTPKNRYIVFEYDNNEVDGVDVVTRIFCQW